VIAWCNVRETRGVSHFGLVIYIKKYLKEKERIMKNSNISPCKNIIFPQKKSSKRNQKSFKILL
jgi:hypothetical protein